MNDIETDILVIGAGISGSALACALRKSGLKVVLIDKSDRPLDTARGDHLQPRSCETLERWGVLDRFFANGAEKRLGSLWFTQDGAPLLESRVDGLEIPHPYFAFINHEKIAELLLESALEAGNTTVIRPIRNWWLGDDNGETRTVRVGLPNSTEIRIRARLLVGADGRNSRTRKSLDIDFSVHKYRRAVAVFFAGAGTPQPERYLKVYLGNSVNSFIPRTHDGCKIGVPVTMQEASAWRRAPSAAIEEFLADLAPGEHVERPYYSDVYAPVYLRAHRWIDSGAVLVGDACHAMHPARSQGMNISIRCVDALASLLMTLPTSLRRSDIDEVLRDYENQMKPPIDARLEDNHRSGLELDRETSNANAELQRHLSAIQANPDALRRYSMVAAGYDLG